MKNKVQANNLVNSWANGTYMLQCSSGLLRGYEDLLEITYKTLTRCRSVQNSCCHTPDRPQGTCKSGRHLIERSRCRAHAILHEANVSLEKTKYLASSSNWLSSKSSRVGKASGRSCSLEWAGKAKGVPLWSKKYCIFEGRSEG